MAHHGNYGHNELLRRSEAMFSDGTSNASKLEEALKKANSESRGHPQGKLTETDQGEISIGVTVKDGAVVMVFGKNVSWVGMDPGQARNIADALYQHATNAEKPTQEKGDKLYDGLEAKDGGRT